MAPYLVLFGRAFPTYSLLALAGAAAAWGYFHWRLRRRGENPGRTEQAFLWGVLGALVGAKLLYLLPQLAADLPLLGQDPALFSARYLTGGFVFYGGLLGALGCLLYTSLKGTGSPFLCYFVKPQPLKPAHATHKPGGVLAPPGFSHTPSHAGGRGGGRVLGPLPLRDGARPTAAGRAVPGGSPLGFQAGWRPFPGRGYAERLPGGAGRCRGAVLSGSMGAWSRVSSWLRGSPPLPRHQGTPSVWLGCRRNSPARCGAAGSRSSP